MSDRAGRRTAAAWPRRLTICALAAAGAACAPLALATSIEDAVSAALQGDPRVSAADARRRAAEFEVDQARGGFLPSIDTDGVFGREKSNIKSLRATGLDNRYLWRREFRVGLSQMLYDGLFTRSEVERRRALLDAAGSGLDEAREQVAFLAVEAYLDVLRNRGLVELALENVAIHEDTLEKVTRRRREGLGTEADRTQTAARLALARSVLTAREGALREAAARYRRVMGDAPDALEDIEVGEPGFLAGNAIDPVRVGEAIQRIVDEAVEVNPSLQVARAQVDAADAQVASARAAYMPQLNLEANVERESDVSGIDGVRNTDNVLLVGRWNLFNGGSDVARERALAERRAAAQDAALDTRRAVEERVAIAIQAKATSEERIQYLRAHVDTSEETLLSYESQLRLGRRTLLDTLNAVNELFTARSNLVSGRYEDILNGYFIEAARGTLVSSLGVDGGS